MQILLLLLLLCCLPDEKTNGLVSDQCLLDIELLLDENNRPVAIGSKLSRSSLPTQSGGHQHSMAHTGKQQHSLPNGMDDDGISSSDDENNMYDHVTDIVIIKKKKNIADRLKI